MARRKTKKRRAPKPKLMTQLKRQAEPALVALGAVTLAAVAIPQVGNNRLVRAGVGFLAGGPVGAGVGYFSNEVMNAASQAASGVTGAMGGSTGAGDAGTFG